MSGLMRNQNDFIPTAFGLRENRGSDAPMLSFVSSSDDKDKFIWPTGVGYHGASFFQPSFRSKGSNEFRPFIIKDQSMKSSNDPQ